MDRGKGGGSGSRSQKKMGAHMGGEFFALGSKGAREDAKSKIASVKSGVSTVDRKREASGTLSNVSKKPKLGGIRTADHAPASSSGSMSAASTSSAAALASSTATGASELWEQIATECDSSELVLAIFTSADQHDNETVLRLLCGAFKQLMASYLRVKVDPALYLSLIYIAKMRPAFFCNDIVTSALLTSLRRDTNVKSRQTVYSHIICSNLLARGYYDRQHWPEIFLRTYIDDAIMERMWVDAELCSPFVQNICAAFRTRTPPQTLLQPDQSLIATATGTTAASAATSGAATNTPSNINIDEDSGDNSMYGGDSSGATRTSDTETSSTETNLCAVQNRFCDNDQIVEKYVTDAIKEQLNKRQQQDCYVRNLIKFLCSSSGLEEVRSLCIGRVEIWLHNGKLMKFAQQLLSYICFNIKSRCFKDHEVLTTLVKVRLKTKPLINFYMACLREMILQQPDILYILLKLVVQNELSNTRNPNNMGMLATMFQSSSEQSANHLAEIYKEILLQRDDCLRTLRVFLREIVRMLRFDINIAQFCKVFLSKGCEIFKQFEQSEFRDRIFNSMVDLVCLCMLLTVSPAVRDANLNLRTNRDQKHSPILLKFYGQMSQIQLDAMTWMHEIVPNLFKPQMSEYTAAMRKLLLLENSEQYSRSDAWPSDPERATLLRMISETPIHEDALLRIILIGITKEIPYKMQDTLELIMSVIKRASTLRLINYPAIQVNKFDIIDFLFSLSEYHHPETIKLPDNYEPPKLAITVNYWMAWMIMLMISAHNPSTFGAFCWNHYPTMKMLIEMCITNQFSAELPTTKEELQIIALERDTILEFETLLAAETSKAVITEETAILLPQVLLMDPMGLPRRLPPTVIEQLRYLNKTYKLGHLFCRSRKPDLLLDIIQRQGTTQSMPWLSDLVQNSEGDFNHLPVQCLCEFLLFNAANISEETSSRDAELVNFLRNLIMNPESNKQTVCEVLDYIFRRLSSTVKQSRRAALDGVKIIFKCVDQDENGWLLRSIPQMPHFKEVRSFLIPQLRAACQVENTPELVMTYIQFIAAHTLHDSVPEMLDHVIDMAQLIVERSTMFQHIVPANTTPLPDTADYLEDNRFQTLNCLFVMFNNFFIKLREHHEPYEWTEYPDLLMVHFDDGIQMPLHLNIIHAFIILLTRSSATMPESLPILEYWFPSDRATPIAYMPNMPHEPVQFLPDWLKLKMIRSSIDRLIEAALCDLTPDQIVLFVQNFGTPVHSMSKLLALLDRAVIEQFDVVKAAILNKAYLSHLIETQQARGAKNGHITIQALELQKHSQPAPDLPKINCQILEQFEKLDIKETVEETKQEPTDIEILTLVLSGKELERNQAKYFRRYMLQLQHGQDVELLSRFLQFVQNWDIEKCLGNMHKNQHICTLMRTLMHCKPVSAQQQQLLQKTVQQLQLKLSQSSAAEIKTAIKQEENEVMEKVKLDTAALDDNMEVIETENEAAATTANNINNIALESIFGLLKSISVTKKEAEKTHKNNDIRSLLGVVKANSLKSTTTYEDVNLVLKAAEQQQQESLMKSSKDLCLKGLLVDWLSQVDPEFCHGDLQLQCKFLFSNSQSDFRYYMLSLICHHTHWQTLHNILQHIMHNTPQGLDSSTVLNFIEALINSPKLWQGRDKSVAKCEQPEIILALKQDEIVCFAQLVIAEGEQEMTNLTNYDYKLCARIKLLFSITSNKSTDLMHFIDCVQQSNCTPALRLKVLQQVYLMYPAIKFTKYPEAGEEQAGQLQSLTGCKTDKVSNYLITCLANLFLKKDFEALSSDTEMLMRKLAASHPALFLRQIGVLASMIQGRAEIQLRTLRDEYHFHRFVQILRTLELLQPVVFDDSYKQELQSALSCYFAFFKNYSYAKEAYNLLTKFVDLLQGYINANPNSALIFIEQYVGLLMDLSAKFSNISGLHQVVQGIALLQHKSRTASELNEDDVKQDIDLDEKVETKPAVVSEAFDDTQTMDNKGAMTVATISNVANKGCNVSPHFLNLIKIIKNSNVEDAILGPLQEIESLTSKRFSFLSELFDRLLELIFSPSAQIRSNAFILLIRHIKHNPGRADINRCTLNAYIQCLRDDNPSVAATAVDNLAEMALLLQEHALEILSVAFSLGIRSRLTTCSQIKRVVQTLMLQHGY